MNFHQYKLKTKKWNHFAKADSLGSFDFYTYIISLDAISNDSISELARSFFRGEKLQGFLTPQQYSDLVKALPLAVHEYTHFVDSTSTIWGLKHLYLMNEAYLSNDIYGSGENNYFKAKLFYDHVRKIRMPDYYTTVTKHQNQRPWRANISIGRVFSANGNLSDQRILFSRFSNFEGKPLARSPISTVSLLEASAMAQEVLYNIFLIKCTHPDFQKVEQSIFTERFLDYLYTPEITEYSVCVHTLANKLQCNDVLSAFLLCALLTRVALNFPENLIQTLVEVCPVAKLLNAPEDSPFVEAIIDGLKHENRGILYYLLCQALPNGAHESQEAARAGVHSAIAEMGIDYQTFQTEAKSRAVELHSLTRKSHIRTISTLSNAGYQNFQQMAFDEMLLDFDNLNVPPALLGDSTSINLFPSKSNQLSNLDLDECFDELYKGQSWVDRFAEACI